MPAGRPFLIFPSDRGAAQPAACWPEEGVLVGPSQGKDVNSEVSQALCSHSSLLVNLQHASVQLTQNCLHHRERPKGYDDSPGPPATAQHIRAQNPEEGCGGCGEKNQC